MNKSELEPSGFTFHTLMDPERPLQSCRLYLPADLAQHLREKEEAVAAIVRKRLEAQAAPPVPPPTRSSRGTTGSIDIVAERAAVKISDTESCKGISHPVYDAYEPVNMLARSRTAADKRDVERIEAIYKLLSAKRANTRAIAWPEDIKTDLQVLACRLPHFAAVTQLVRERLLAAAANDLPPRIPPILLLGDPGLGKTHYCRELADVLNTTIRCQPYDNAETTSQLLGSDRHWSNTHEGILFELLALGRHANPIVILDEIDKARSPRGDVDPLSPLHSILEPSTASSLRDISLEFTMDASLVTFIATANDARRIPETLLSRFRVFEICQPQGADAIAVAHEVVLAVLGRLELPQPPDVRRIAIRLAHLPARQVQQAVEDAAARILAEGRQQLTARDVRLDEDVQPNSWLH